MRIYKIVDNIFLVMKDYLDLTKIYFLILPTKFLYNKVFCCQADFMVSRNLLWNISLIKPKIILESEAENKHTVFFLHSFVANTYLFNIFSWWQLIPEPILSQTLVLIYENILNPLPHSSTRVECNVCLVIWKKI